MKNFGILLTVVGIVTMAITGYSYVNQEKVVDLGSILITKKEIHPME
jgi:hypothetical protein